MKSSANSVWVNKLLYDNDEIQIKVMKIVKN